MKQSLSGWGYFAVPLRFSSGFPGLSGVVVGAVVFSGVAFYR